MCILPTCTDIYTICMPGVMDPLTGVTDSCERPYGSWESKSDPLEEQQVLLTAESSLQPSLHSSLKLLFFFLLLPGMWKGCYVHMSALLAGPRREHRIP